MRRFDRRSLSLTGLGAVAVLSIGTSLAVGGTTNRTNDVRSGLNGVKPKNVIFLLGDGMGTQEITEARYYRGVGNKLNVDRLPFTGFDTTYTVKGDGRTPDYDPDSAGTGTQWATGRKTVDERDSQGPSASLATPGDNAAYKTVLEYAQEAGKKVGDVTTADLTDATPAVLAAHISNRNCSGPANMTATVATATPKCLQESKEVGGLGSIAEQEVDHKLDVALGGGFSRFAQTITGGPDAGKTVIQSAQDKGIQVVDTADGLAGVDPSKPVLGLFGKNSTNTPNMSLEWKGSTAVLGDPAPETCQENRRPAGEPGLAVMTDKAIKLLDGAPKGFFLQVEGASIDKQDHAANACQQVGETIAFDNAVGVALDYQRTHPDTLVVVTADHGHTSQIVGEDTTGAGRPTGYSNALRTADGQILQMTYGTAGYQASGAPTPAPPSQQHTGTVVPVWATGPQAANILGTNDHTDLFDLLRGVKDDQDAPAPSTTTSTVTGTRTVTTPGAPAVTTSPDRTPRLGVAVLRSISASVLRSAG
ncbi:MAG: 6-phosphatase, partial [Solirubrobacterales bacterium]|nr:6-phosphatase [Solirubrobacterales bacterium]